MPPSPPPKPCFTPAESRLTTPKVKFKVASSPGTPAQVLYHAGRIHYEEAPTRTRYGTFDEDDEDPPAHHTRVLTLHASSILSLAG